MKAIAPAGAALVLLLSACSTPSTLQGSNPSTGESFAGSYTSDPFTGVTMLYDNTPVVFASSTAAICQGNTHGDAASTLVMDVTCQDGRSGTISFTGGPVQMTGSGKLGKDPVTFTLLNDAAVGTGEKPQAK